jgi:hypothetical protein
VVVVHALAAIEAIAALSARSAKTMKKGRNPNETMNVVWMQQRVFASVSLIVANFFVAVLVCKGVVDTLI